MSSPSINQDKELAEFFTDVEPLRKAFENTVVTPTLTKRLFVIHGVGGVGKSSLLRMFRLHCKSVNIPVALASGDEAKSALDVLARWADDLKADHVAFPAFGRTYEHYREIQAKVEAQAKKAGGRAADIASKAASKTAEAAGGALAGAAVGSIIARNFNLTFAMATGQYFKWAAHDDVCRGDFLARCVDVLDQDASAVLCFTRSVTINNQGLPQNERPSRPDWSASEPHVRFRQALALEETMPVFGVIRSETLRRTPLIGSYPASDRPLLARLSLHGRFVEIPEFLFCHAPAQSTVHARLRLA